MSQRAYPKQLALAQRHLSRADPLMRRLIRAHGACGLEPAWARSPYEALIEAVIYQQLNGNVAGKIFRRFVELFPGAPFPPPAQVLAASDGAMRSAGLSRQKIAYIRDIAAHTGSGVVPLKRAAIARSKDEAIIERITQVKGIGRWTVEMLLIFTLGRLDVLPVDDYGVRKGYTRAAGADEPVKPRELRERGEIWAPYRSVASWYLWRAAEAD
ncbi:MAG: DNA-3-methyladenine glycosylase 2 family protein [Sterolibacteriaceae bacterium]|nr:DNA-3-methyladenine glycosylase 2 family protein [Sterolibacteriaceae bacterium]MBK9086654.1 DNA-3-methyladenine glycosylase 2 family protein [Sterolibacteriaceae bacterium]